MFNKNSVRGFITKAIGAGATLALTLSLGAAALAAGTDIGPEQAEAIALEQAGLTEKEVSRLRTVQDRDDGALEYEVEFFTDETEFDYTVDAASGAVWQESRELRDRGRQADGDVGAEAAQAAALAHAELDEKDAQKLSVRKELDDGYLEYEVRWLTETHEYEYVIDGAAGTVWQWEKTVLPEARTAPDGGADPAAGDVGAEAARDAALTHAGLTLDQVTRMHVEWETCDDYFDHHHDGHHPDHNVYEISFRQGGYEYEYVVDSATGQVLEHEREYDD